ncbi:DNA-binding storekeeper protein-related transcriptional regulator [Trifolium repens]|nr:DNA-binding storekeeper protein-related transcriptional regulator [Trifolium repens]
MAKKRQPTTTAAAKDDQPLTPASKNDQPPPSKKPEEEKVEEKDDEEVTSEEASSSEGEEEDDDDDDDDEEEQTPSSKTVPPAKSESKKDEVNEDEEETDTDSDSDQEPPPKLKSINLKSIDETLKSKPQPKSSAAPARSGTKRSADDDTKQSKKKKTIAAADDEKVKEVDNKKSGDDSKKLFVRVFNEDDELAILKGIFDFTEKTGTDPLKYPTAFYQDVKSSIHFPVTLDQLKDKVRRLKLKFENKMKSCKNGKTPTFSKPIEEEMFEFSKKIWGGTIVEENGKHNEKPSKKKLAVKKSPTTKKLVMEPDLPLVVRKETSKVGSSSDGKENPGLSLMLNEMEQFDRSVSSVFGSGADLLKSGVELIEESKRVELERRWNELRFAELKLIAMRAELFEDQGRLIMDALKPSSGD